MYLKGTPINMYLWIKSLELRSARHEFAGLEQLEWLLPLPEDVPHSAPATAQVQRVQLDGISDQGCKLQCIAFNKSQLQSICE